MAILCIINRNKKNIKIPKKTYPSVILTSLNLELETSKNNINSLQSDLTNQNNLLNLANQNLEQSTIEAKNFNNQIRTCNSELTKVKNEIELYKGQILDLEEEKRGQDLALSEAERRAAEAETKAVQAESRANSVQIQNTSTVVTNDNSNAELKEELETIQKEQDDLLELLADQQNKIKEYAGRLRNMGEEVTDDSEEEDSEEESE